MLKDGWGDLHRACVAGNVKSVEDALGASEGVQQPHGHHPLTETLLAATKYGWTPLHAAADAGQCEVVELLIDTLLTHHSSSSTTAPPQHTLLAARMLHSETLSGETPLSLAYTRQRNLLWASDSDPDLLHRLDRVVGFLKEAVRRVEGADVGLAPTPPLSPPPPPPPPQTKQRMRGGATARQTSEQSHSGVAHVAQQPDFTERPDTAVLSADRAGGLKLSRSVAAYLQVEEGNLKDIQSQMVVWRQRARQLAACNRRTRARAVSLEMELSRLQASQAGSQGAHSSEDNADDDTTPTPTNTMATTPSGDINATQEQMQNGLQSAPSKRLPRGNIVRSQSAMRFKRRTSPPPGRKLMRGGSSCGSNGTPSPWGSGGARTTTSVPLVQTAPTPQVARSVHTNAPLRQRTVRRKKKPVKSLITTPPTPKATVIPIISYRSEANEAGIAAVVLIAMLSAIPEEVVGSFYKGYYEYLKRADSEGRLGVGWGDGVENVTVQKRERRGTTVSRRRSSASGKGSIDLPGLRRRTMPPSFCNAPLPQDSHCRTPSGSEGDDDDACFPSAARLDNISRRWGAGSAVDGEGHEAARPSMDLACHLLS